MAAPPRRADTLRAMNEFFTAPSSREDVERYLAENDVEFLFAQFVDMHGKPNAKLVPARHLDGLLEDGAGFAGFAAGAIGQRPHDPDMAAMPDVRSLTPLPWRPERRPPRLRRHRRGRGVALLPAHDPAPRARARALDGLRVHGRRRARVLPRAQARRRLDRAGRSARHARPALLRHACAHAQPRLRVPGVATHHGARLEQLRHTTTRTPTASSSRTSTSPTPSPPATARSSSATWSSRSPRSAA